MMRYNKVYKEFYGKQKDLRRVSQVLERVTGVEPVPAAWKAAMIPLHHTRTCDTGRGERT